MAQKEKREQEKERIIPKEVTDLFGEPGKVETPAHTIPSEPAATTSNSKKVIQAWNAFATEIRMHPHLTKRFRDRLQQLLP